MDSPEANKGRKGDGHGKGQTNAGPEAMASTGADVAPIVVIAMMTDLVGRRACAREA